MITIKVFGIDPYLLRNISKDATPKLAQIYEISPDEINFLGAECLYVHDGVEQNTWNLLIEVSAPKKVSVLENEAFKILVNYFKDVAINFECVFYYFSSDNYHHYINTDYPRFMKEDNLVNVDYQEEDISIGEDGEVDEEELYLGNAFEGFEEKIKNKK